LAFPKLLLKPSKVHGSLRLIVPIDKVSVEMGDSALPRASVAGG